MIDPFFQTRVEEHLDELRRQLRHLDRADVYRLERTCYERDEENVGKDELEELLHDHNLFVSQPQLSDFGILCNIVLLVNVL